MNSLTLETFQFVIPSDVTELQYWNMYDMSVTLDVFQMLPERAMEPSANTRLRQL